MNDVKRWLSQTRFSLSDLVAIMAYLRSPQGCPWDRAQTHSSIKANLIEEAYEAVDAIDSGDPARMADELGDVLLQVVFHAQMAAEADRFTLDDVISAIARKLIRRHTHVFGDDETATAKDALATWADNKRKEKGQTTMRATLSDVPASLPTLMRAETMQNRAARFGFDWPDASGPRAKINEELAEIDAADDTTREKEIGDLLLAVVNFARHVNVHAETALLSSLRVFVDRLICIDATLAQTGQTFETLTDDERERLWQTCKSQVDASVMRTRDDREETLRDAD